MSLASSVLAWIAVIVSIEAVAEIVAHGKVFDPLRERLEKLPGYVGWWSSGLVSCAYCMSVWLSAIGALVVPGPILPAFGSSPDIHALANYAATLFVLHRASNVWHKVVWRWTEMVPFVLFLTPRDDSVPDEKVNHDKEQAL